MRSILFLTFLLLIFALPTVKAQVTGRVVDATNGEPLEYATVAIYKAGGNTLVTGVVTGQNGEFTLEDVKKGTYFLETSFIGYETKKGSQFTLAKRNQKKDVGAIGINPSQLFLDEVVLSGKKATVINKVDRQVYETGAFKNSLGGSGTDVIKNLPSVSVDALGEISVRGSEGFVVLLNGKPIQSNATLILGQLPANAIERVELITAPSAKYDPEGKAGILNIITKKGAADGTFTQINVRGGFPSIEDYDNAEPAHRYGADITHNIRKGNWNVSMGASYQRNDIQGRREGDVFTIINDTLTRFPSDGERSFDEVNYSGRFTVDFTPDTLNTYSVGFYAGKRSKDRTADILYFDNHAITPADGGDRIYTFQYFNENLRIRKGDFVLGSFDYAHTFKNNSNISTSFLYEYTLLGGPTTNLNLGFPDTSVVLQDEFNTNDNPLHGMRFQVDYQFKPLSIGQLETGYQFRNLDHTGDFVYERRNQNTGEYELVPEFSSEVDLTRQIHSGYLQLSKSMDKWEYSAGLRLEAMDRNLDLKDKIGVVDTTYMYDYVKLFPSAAIQYTVNDDVKLKAAYSKRVERTTSFKMNPFPEREHSETLEQGDPTLRPEFIDLAEIGVTKSFEEKNSLYLTAYYRNVDNLINRVNTVYNDTILNRIYSNIGSGKSLGFEVGSEIEVAEKWSNFVGLNIYNYQIDGNFNGKTIDENSWQYSINLNSTYDFSDTASLQFTFNYLSERQTAQGEDSRFYSPNLTFQKSFFNNQLTASLQWMNMDMGLFDTNEQRITTQEPGSFYTTTNYVYEVDMVILNLAYTFNQNKNKSKFIESEFGKREF
ncbi:TonB-dependent receptor domain-containing protein [Galbibacter mesophilus]|uniref:TonB-dependent receptor domain-containing protein n=1 Tax=Galbibacter mesophilus TaxID=379069 RepID=UPI001A915313|nr:TonB-dependent receptor [Galbibacter mesophilus]MCM5662778.1 TonB-dependent receptor [Galbibacter mesophilus]